MTKYTISRSTPTVMAPFWKAATNESRSQQSIEYLNLAKKQQKIASTSDIIAIERSLSTTDGVKVSRNTSSLTRNKYM